MPSFCYCRFGGGVLSLFSIPLSDGLLSIRGRKALLIRLPGGLFFFLVLLYFAILGLAGEVLSLFFFPFSDRLLSIRGSKALFIRLSRGLFFSCVVAVFCYSRIGGGFFRYSLFPSVMGCCLSAAGRLCSYAYPEVCFFFLCCSCI